MFFVIGLEQDTLILPTWAGFALLIPTICLMTAIIMVLKNHDNTSEAVRQLYVHCELCLATKRMDTTEAITLKECPNCPTRLLLAKHDIVVPK